MTKTYPEQLAEWIKRREKKKRDEALVGFLAIRDDVKSALDAGYSAKTVWCNMHQSKRFSFGYDTFLKYVNKLIRNPRAGQAGGNESAKVSPPKPAGTTSPATLNKKPPAALDGFTFDPVPKKEELL